VNVAKTVSGGGSRGIDLATAAAPVAHRAQGPVEEDTPVIRLSHALFVAGFALVSIACAGTEIDGYAEEEFPLLAVDTTVQKRTGMEPARASTVESFILVEGLREPMTYHLYESPAGFPLGFETYLPADMTPGSVASGEGDAIRFVPAFGDPLAQPGGLSITVPSGELSAAEAQRLVREIAAGLGSVERVTGGGFTWALEEYRFQGPTLVGSVALGRHDGRYFYITAAYPAEMGDGFGPRAHRILGEWRWADGSRLGS
jgi:hypothetical protein